MTHETDTIIDTAWARLGSIGNLGNHLRGPLGIQSREHATYPAIYPPR